MTASGKTASGKTASGKTEETSLNDQAGKTDQRAGQTSLEDQAGKTSLEDQAGTIEETGPNASDSLDSRVFSVICDGQSKWIDQCHLTMLDVEHKADKRTALLSLVAGLKEETVVLTVTCDTIKRAVIKPVDFKAYAGHWSIDWFNDVTNDTGLSVNQPVDQPAYVAVYNARLTKDGQPREQFSDRTDTKSYDNVRGADGKPTKDSAGKPVMQANGLDFRVDVQQIVYRVIEAVKNPSGDSLPKETKETSPRKSVKPDFDLFVSLRRSFVSIAKSGKNPLFTKETYQPYKSVTVDSLTSDIYTSLATLVKSDQSQIDEDF